MCLFELWFSQGICPVVALPGHIVVLFLFFFKESPWKNESGSVVSNCLWPKEYSPWNSLGQNTGVGSLSFLQGIFPTHGSPRSTAMRADSLPSEPQGKPKNTGVGSLSLLQQIFPMQDLNQGLLHCRQILNTSPTLINSILPSFCLLSGNSFPICAQIMTVGRGEKGGKEQ